MPERGNVTAVIGGQLGSEGKGVIVQHIAQDYRIHVRVGAPNAGHSFYHPQFKRVFKMQSIPVGWVNEDAFLIIGPGALINLEVLSREIEEVQRYSPGIKGRLLIDQRAGIIDPVLHDEGHVDGDMHKRIGSTGEGVGAARLARISRDPERFYFFEDAVRRPEWRHLAGMACSNTPSLLREHVRSGENILLEGTQGTGLSMIHGPWPYTTSNDCGVASMLSDAGIAPFFLTKVICVVRTYPIRVAGNSGPMHRETDWDVISQRMGRDVLERTTVTKKVRRIGHWDSRLVANAVRMNAPTSLALTFVDYLCPEDEGKTRMEDLSATTTDFIQQLELDTNTNVSMIGTGGQHGSGEPPWRVIMTGKPI